MALDTGFVVVTHINDTHYLRNFMSPILYSYSMKNTYNKKTDIAQFYFIYLYFSD